MRTLFVSIVTAAGLFAAAGNVTAQNAPPAADNKAAPGGQRSPGGPRAGAMSPEKRIEMYKSFGCSDEQIAKIKAIMEAGVEKMKAAAGDRDKMREFMKSQREEIDAILTPEQKAKAEAARPARPAGGHGPAKPGEKPADKPADKPAAE